MLVKRIDQIVAGWASGLAGQGATCCGVVGHYAAGQIEKKIAPECRHQICSGGLTKSVLLPWLGWEQKGLESKKQPAACNHKVDDSAGKDSSDAMRDDPCTSGGTPTWSIYGVPAIWKVISAG